MLREPLYGYSEPELCPIHDIELTWRGCSECLRERDMEAEWEREEAEWEREEAEWEEWHDQE